jgi:hypothetical protein
MRSAATVLVALLLAGAHARADQPDTGRLPNLPPLKVIGERAKPLRDAWERCLATEMRRFLDSDLTPDELAEQALARCQAQQTRLRTTLARDIGPAQAIHEVAAKVYGRGRKGSYELVHQDF